MQVGTRLSLKRNRASTKTFFSEGGGMDFAPAPFPLAPSLYLGPFTTTAQQRSLAAS